MLELLKRCKRPRIGGLVVIQFVRASDAHPRNVCVELQHSLLKTSLRNAPQVLVSVYIPCCVEPATCTTDYTCWIPGSKLCYQASRAAHQDDCAEQYSQFAHLCQHGPLVTKNCSLCLQDIMLECRQAPCLEATVETIRVNILPTIPPRNKGQHS
jgi:hypothetical protein